MKKFIIFLVVIVAAVGVGMTIFYFVRNNEKISVATTEIYCNTGDIISVKSLGIKIENANITKKTKFDYNAGGEEVEKFISYDADKNAYVVNSSIGGEVIVVISTTNKKIADFTITVHIGDGTEENPYYIFNETDLGKIGKVYSQNKNYILMNDIVLSENFKPIGYLEANQYFNFGGTFDGNGYKISQMSLSGEMEYAGFFAFVTDKGLVKNLKLEGANINGKFSRAGVLAGIFYGNAERIEIVDATITNIASNSTTGAFAGTILNDIIMSYAENVSINIGDANNVVANAVVGGFVGFSNQGTLNACYTNNVSINANTSSIVVGGMIGELMISAHYGIVQQSYANTTCNNANYGAFIGKITKTSDFDNSQAKVLRHLIGNIAIVGGKSTGNIVDSDLVKTFDKTYFENKLSKGSSIFFHKETALYMIRGFGSVRDVLSTDEYIYYAVDTVSKTTWDYPTVWKIEIDRLPTLVLGGNKPTLPATSYLNRDLSEKAADSEQSFKDIFKQGNIDGQKVKLATNIELTNWKPVEVKNSVIDGNNKTITIRFNSSLGTYGGLFSNIENSSISNLVIKFVGKIPSCDQFGGIAANILSSKDTEASTLNGIVIYYENADFSNTQIKKFGGIAGSTTKNCLIKNSRALGLNVSENSKLQTAAMLVGTHAGKIYRCNLEGTICGTVNVGTVAGINCGTIDTVETGGGDIAKAIILGGEGVKAGGVVASNSGIVANVKIRTNLNIKNFGKNSMVGGVAGLNEGEISNVTILGESITVADKTGKILLAGIVAQNSSKGKINNTNNKLKTVGTYNAGKTQYIGGIVADNSGNVQQCVSQSNLYGNYVSGVVAIMRSGKVDQAVVGTLSQNASSKKISTSKIKLEGDKYLAGVCVEFKNGTISNVQSACEIKGKTNSTRSSLIVLIFPYGTKLVDTTIDSSISGYGKKYREVWTDFANYSNKSEFGFSAGATGDSRFNIYTNNSHHGCMQNVVINGSNGGVSSAIASKCEAFWWAGVLTVDYEDNSASSYVKVTSNFSTTSQFQGSFTFVVATYTKLWNEVDHKITRSLTFKIGSVWKAENGIRLSFLDSMV